MQKIQTQNATTYSRDGEEFLAGKVFQDSDTELWVGQVFDGAGRDYWTGDRETAERWTEAWI